MKAEIDENGILTIATENPTEAYALKMWWKDYSGDPWPKGHEDRAPSATLQILITEESEAG